MWGRQKVMPKEAKMRENNDLPCCKRTDCQVFAFMNNMRCRTVFVTSRRCTCSQLRCRPPLSRAVSTKPQEEGQKNRPEDKEHLQEGDGTSGVRQNEQKEEQEEGAMSRRLNDMAEEAYLEGGRSARKNIQEAGFSDELKAKLEERITASSFRSDNAAAFSIADMPVCLA
jgi:hypothetical protein